MQVQTAQFAETGDLLLGATQLRVALGLEGVDPLHVALLAGSAQIRDRGQAGQGPLNDLEAIGALPQRVVALIEVRARQVYQALRLGLLGIVVEAELRLGAIVDQGEVELLPLGRLVGLLVQVAVVLDALDLLEPDLVAALAQRGIDLLGGLLHHVLLVELRLNAVDHGMIERVALHNLLLAIPIDYSVQALECPPSHQIPNALLLDAKALNLVVDMEEQRVVPR